MRLTQSIEPPSKKRQFDVHDIFCGMIEKVDMARLEPGKVCPDDRLWVEAV